MLMQTPRLFEARCQREQTKPQIATSSLFFPLQEGSNAQLQRFIRQYVVFVGEFSSV